MNSNLASADEHETVFAELPWYANGTLPENLVDQVDQHLAHCTICQQELNLMRKTFESVSVSAPPQNQVDQSLERVMQRIDTYEEERATTGEIRQLGWFAQWVENLKKKISGFGSGSYWVPAASLAAIAVVSIVSVQLLQSPNENDYSVLTSGEPAPLSLRVHFKESAEPAVVIRMVQTIGISASVQSVSDRVYLVNLPADAAIDDLNDAFTQIKSDPTVQSVEAVLNPTNPEK